jgi:hypothetical protein
MTSIAPTADDAAALRYAGVSGHPFSVCITLSRTGRLARVALDSYRSLDHARRVATCHRDSDTAIYRRVGDEWERIE